MANGKDLAASESERLKALDAALAKSPDRPGPVDDLVGRIGSIAKLLREVAAGISRLDRGDSDDIRNFADHLEQLVAGYAQELLKRRQKSVTDLERILGKISQ